MREFIYNSWNGVMNHNKNPLRHIPDFNTRHMIMQVLAWMWCITFSLIVGSWTVFGISAVGHVVLLGAIAITVGTFETAKRNPYMFGSYHSYGRQRGYTIYHDKQGNPHKVYFDDNDPGGEHA
jgi:hypothetical protein